MPEAAGPAARTRRVTPRRAALALAALLLLYVLAGELLQAWAHIHMDAWQHGPRFGSAAHHEAEWQRVDAAFTTATGLWPWKTSLEIDKAQVALFGLFAGYLDSSDAGPEILAAVARAKERQMETGELLVLEIRGHLVSGDIDAARDAIHRLQKAAPHARPWWDPLIALLNELAAHDPALQPLAHETSAWHTPHN